VAKQKRILSGEKNSKLYSRMSRLSSVTQFADSKHDEAGAMLTSFGDLEEAFREYLEDYLPRLADEKNTKAELDHLLTDVGHDVFEHVLYHLRAMRFYGYMHEDGGAARRARNRRQRGRR
jgi:hypothetical protein